MASKGFSKRLGFKRRNTEQEPVTVTELNQLEGEGSGSAGAGHVGNGNSIIDDAVNDISEEEANQRLHVFKQDHRWDPNMPDSTIDMVDAVAEAHDHKGEAQLVGDVIENSPYPEVRILSTAIFSPTDASGPRRRAKLR